MEESMTAHVGIMECTKSMGREIQKGAWWAQWHLVAKRASISFSGTFKMYANLWAEPGDSHPIINESGAGWGMGGSQAW